MELLGFAVRLLIGGLFIWSAVPKLLAPLRFQQIVLRYGVFPASWARPLSRALPWVEIAFAAMLLSGSLVVAAAGLSAVLFLAFVVLVLVATRRNEGEQCGCFGRISLPAPWLLAQDLVLVVLALFIAYAPASHFSVWQFVRDPAMAHARLALSLALGITAVAALTGYLARWKPVRERGGIISKEGFAA